MNDRAKVRYAPQGTGLWTGCIPHHAASAARLRHSVAAEVFEEIMEE